MQMPTQEELLNDKLIEVKIKADNSWRHGSYMTVIYRRDSDQTFWMVKYAVSTDCETHGLRDGKYSCVQVYPYQIEVTRYSEERPK